MLRAALNNKSSFLCNRLMATFAKFDRSKPHVNGNPMVIQLEQSAILIMGKPLSHLLLPSFWQKSKGLNTLNMAPLTRPPKKRQEVSQLILPQFNTKQKLATMVHFSSFSSRGLSWTHRLRQEYDYWCRKDGCWYPCRCRNRRTYAPN